MHYTVHDAIVSFFLYSDSIALVHDGIPAVTIVSSLYTVTVLC